MPWQAVDIVWLLLLHIVVIKWLLLISQRHFKWVKTVVTLIVSETLTVLLHRIGLSGYWFCTLTFTVWFISLHFIFYHLSYPGAPKRAKVPDIVIRSGTSCLLQWSTPRDGGADIQGYKLEICRKNGFEWCQVTSKEITSNNYRIDNLLRGHEYRFRVMAHNVYGLGPPGCETDFLLMTEPPSSPRNIEISDLTESSCLVSWLPPEDDGGSSIRTYYLEKCLIQGNFAEDWDFCALVEGDKYIHRVTGLDSGLQYLFRISAVNQAGSSPTVQTSNAVMAFGMDVYDGTIVSHSLEELQALSRDKASLMFVRGADELNSLIVLILSLQPEQTTRENLPVVRRDLKVLTSRALFFFQESLQTLDVVQKEIDKRLCAFITDQKEAEDELHTMKFKLVGMKNQLEEQEKRVDESQQQLRKVEADQQIAKATLDETVKQLEQKKTEQTVTKVGGSLGIVGGVGAVVGAGVFTVVTGGLAAPLLIPAVGVAVGGGVAAAGGTGAIVAGCTVLEKNKKAAENAVQLASEKLDDKQKAFKRQEKELNRCRQNVEEEKKRIGEIEGKLTQLLRDIKDLQTKQREHHGVFERLRECVAYLTSTAAKAEVLDDVMKYMNELKSVVPLLADVAKHLNQKQVLELEMFSYVDQRVLMYNMEMLAIQEDTPDGLEVLPAQNILQEQELLGSQVTQWESFMLGLPSFVLELGKTVVMSNVKDFPLNNTGKKFKFLRNPQSFRACLHQVSSDSWKMLNAVHGRMEQIRLLTQQVSVHSASAANVMSRGVDAEVIHYLPENLAPLKHMTEKAEKLCKETESEFNEWIAMLTELLEASVETHSLSESQRKEAREAFSIVLSDIHGASREKARLSEELQDFQRSLDRVSHENNKHLTGLPNGYGLATIFNANIITNAISFRFGMFSHSCEEIWKKREQKKKKDIHVPISKRQEDDQLVELLKQAEMSLGALDDLKQSIMPRGFIESCYMYPDNVQNPKVRIGVFYKKVKDMKKLKYQVTLEKILKSTADFMETLFKRSKSLEIYREDLMRSQVLLLECHGAISSFTLLATQQLRADAATQKLNFETKKASMKVTREKAEKAVIVNVAQHHVNQEMMKMTESYFKLQEAKRLYDSKSWDIHKVNNRIKSDLLELAEVDGSCMSLHDTVMSLSDAIKGLNFIKQQWAGFSQMFQFVGNRTEHCLGASVDHFAEIAATESSRLEKGRGLSQHARQLLWQEASEACALAQCLHLVADEYVTASSEHLLTPVNQLGRLVLPCSETVKMERLQSLQKKCIESQNGLEKQIESSHRRRMAAFNTAIQDVMDGMKQEVASTASQRTQIDLESFA